MTLLGHSLIMSAIVMSGMMPEIQMNEFEKALRRASVEELIEIYNLILQKKCSLSASKRRMLSAFVDELVRKGWLIKKEDGTVTNILSPTRN